MRKWTCTHTKLLLSHPRLEVYEDTVKLSDGHETDYIRFSNHSAVIIIPIRDDGKMLVQKEYNYPSDEVLYQFPGGKTEDGEDISIAAARELAEEAQVKGSLECIGSFYLDNRRHSGKMHVFLATNLAAAPTEADATEEFEDFWLTEQEIDDLVTRGAFPTHTGLAAWIYYKLRN